MVCYCLFVGRVGAPSYIRRREGHYVSSASQFVFFLHIYQLVVLSITFVGLIHRSSKLDFYLYLSSSLRLPYLILYLKLIFYSPFRTVAHLSPLEDGDLISLPSLAVTACHLLF